ncbi:tetratricopeptide repeat protein 37-like [Patiria miniata]|uniref:Tetratricopeptide repeat protein 37 n=1 Tax=Patiria miniata TaxID=46514 RepID=A0A914BME0_PATMI|nr:tetratricopeptide repeat protein 37-like [Patiria miniata]
MASGGSSKEIKQLLKNAREAIRSKEYKEALKHCKAVLKQDKTNYNALVFVGVAAAELDQPDQAVAAYRKAIETDQQQLLAWQGLAGFYEKSGNPDHRPELAGVYSQLRELFQSKDPKKWREVSEKLARLQDELGDTEQAVQVLKSLIQSEESEDAPASVRHWIQIADALAKVPALVEEYIMLLERAYKIILESGEDRQQHFGNYIKFLSKCNDVSDDRVRTECLRMHELFPSDTYPLTILAGIYLKCKPECLDEVAESVYTKLHSLDETSSSAFLGIGQTSLARRNYLLARDKLQEGLNGSRNNVHGWLYLAMAQLGLHDNRAAVESSKEGLKVLTVSKQLAASQLKRALLTVQADALLDAGTRSQAQKALQIYQKAK